MSHHLELLTDMSQGSESSQGNCGDQKEHGFCLNYVHYLLDRGRGFGPLASIFNVHNFDRSRTMTFMFSHPTVVFVFRYDSLYPWIFATWPIYLRILLLVSPSRQQGLKPGVDG